MIQTVIQTNYLFIQINQTMKPEESNNSKPESENLTMEQISKLTKQEFGKLSAAQQSEYFCWKMLANLNSIPDDDNPE